MNTIFSLVRNATPHNLLFDEYFAPYQSIIVLACNYDGNGTALCRGDDQLVELSKVNLRRILFGVELGKVEAYLISIFDPETESDEISHGQGEIPFRQPELQGMKKYDLANLAKQTLKEVRAQASPRLCYYRQVDAVCVEGV